LANLLRTDDDFMKDDEDEEHDAMDMDEDRMDDDTHRGDDGTEPKSPVEGEAGNLSVRESIRRDRDRETKERQRRAKEKAKIELLMAPARGHPPAIYYLPKVLLPSQRRFIDKRKEAVSISSHSSSFLPISHRLLLLTNSIDHKTA
jgi:hypothetical protein